MNSFCRKECPYKDTADCKLPDVPEWLLNGRDKALGYLASSVAIVGSGLSGIGNMEDALYAQRAAAARVDARGQQIQDCIGYHSELVRLAIGETGK